MRMHNPAHPGELIKNNFLEHSDLCQSEIARRLQVNPATFSRLIQGKASVSAEMAIRLSQVLGLDAETWLNMQAQYDIAQLEASDLIGHLERISPKHFERHVA